MTKQLRVLEFVTGLPVEAGTTTFFVEICNRLSDAGLKVTAAVEPLPHSLDFAMFRKEVTLLTVEPILRGERHYVTFGRDQPDVPRSEPLDFSQCSFDLVHIHGAWAPVLHRVAAWARRNNLPVVWSPHGMLTPWALGQGRLKKKVLWHWFQGRDLRKATRIHVTAASEVEDVRRLGIKTPTVTIPLGVTPAFSVEEVTAIKREAEKGSVRTLLFVSRVQKKKGIANLIRAWSELKTRDETTRGWRVRIVGPDEEGHTAELQALCRELKCTDDFEFAGPLRGEALQREYAAADLFVLPTLSENFGSVVIESLACGTPVITTEGAPWAALVEQGCGWWVKIGAEPLAKALREAMTMSADERREMGLRGRRWVEATFSWTAVVDSLRKMYQELESSKFRV